MLKIVKLAFKREYASYIGIYIILSLGAGLKSLHDYANLYLGEAIKFSNKRQSGAALK